MSLTFENLLAELGGLGRFQICLCIFGFLVVLPVSMTLYVPMFTLTVPDHRCALPDYPNDTYEVQSSYHQSLINLTIPVDEDGTMDPCTFYNRTDMESNATRIQCDRWVYDKTYFDRSLIEQASVVCERKKFRTYANMLMILAEVFAAPLQGIVADIFGRRISLIGCVIGLIVGSIGSAFVVGIRSLLVLRFLSGAGTIQSFVAVYVLGVEFLVPRYRQHYAVMLNILWATGGLILTGIAYFVRDFMHLILGVGTPTVLFLIALYFIPESARWLIVKGKFQKARKTLQRVARINRCQFPEELFNDVVAASQQKRAALEGPTTVVKHEEKDLKAKLNPEDNIVTEKDETIWTFLSHRVLFIRFLILLANWVIVALVYYALVFNVSNMAGSVYRNFTLLNTADLAGLVTVYMTSDKIGRRSTYAGFLLLASCSCLSSLLPLFLAKPAIAQIAIVALCMFGRVGVAACYSIMYLYTSELVPTGQRNTFIGVFSTFSRMGGVAGPYVADLGYLLGGNMKSVLPLLVCGTLGLVAFFLTLFLPETMGKALPSCVNEALNMGRKEKSREKQVELDLLVTPTTNGQVCDGMDGYLVEVKNP